MCNTISIHALLAESDACCSSRWRNSTDFYPRSPCGERLTAWIRHCNMTQFLSTLSLRRATAQRGYILLQFRYFYPRSPCGERLAKRCSCSVKTVISIHALLAESDLGAKVSACNYISFLSTLSLRRATLHHQRAVKKQCYFYPRSPCGERHCLCVTIPPSIKFLSTLSLRRATGELGSALDPYLFLSTLSLRRATPDRPACGSQD